MAKIYKFLCVGDTGTVVYGDTRLFPERLPIQDVPSNVGMSILGSLTPLLLVGGGSIDVGKSSVTLGASSNFLNLRSQSKISLSRPKIVQ